MTFVPVTTSKFLLSVGLCRKLIIAAVSPKLAVLEDYNLCLDCPISKLKYALEKGFLELCIASDCVVIVVVMYVCRTDMTFMETITRQTKCEGECSVRLV